VAAGRAGREDSPWGLATPPGTCSNPTPGVGRAASINLFVVTSEPISAPQLRDALSRRRRTRPHRGEGGGTGAPGKRHPLLAADVDEAIARAREVEAASVESLDREGVTARGDTRESDPVQAIQDALQTFPADRILVFTHPGSDKRYREDLDPSEIEERFGVPVSQATVSAERPDGQTGAA
jgi:hypothetical protein